MNQICKICNIEKILEDFPKNNNHKNGHIKNCKDCYNLLQRNKWIENKDEYAIKRKERRLKKLEKYRESEKIRKSNYRKNNKEKVNKNYREYMKKYRDNNPSFRMHKRISWIIKSCLDQKASSSYIFSKLGYNIDELKIHLESLFKHGMTWSNYGEWHIDHVTPQSWLPFTNTDDENFTKCWSLQNLQPLWAKDNMKKGNRYSG